VGLLEKSKNQSIEETPEEEYAHDVLVKLEDTLHSISPIRVVIVSLVALMIISSTIVAMTWIVPYDKVTVDVVYIQSSAGHVILTEVDNDGSRAISDLSLVIRFINSDDIEIDRTSFNKSSLPAHSSVSGDSLELIVIGPSVWEDYIIDIDLEYTKNNNDKYNIELEYVVGEWKMEQFSHGTGIDFF
tara:strand:- start:1793 stop:2353 length:561 start_codon:yes stop_codon:yes gene_type:complete